MEIEKKKINYNEVNFLDNDNISNHANSISSNYLNSLNLQIKKNNFNNLYNPKLFSSMKFTTKNFLSSSIKGPSILLLNKSNNSELKNKSYSKTFGKINRPYDDPLNLNFGLKKGAPLKVINTTILTTTPIDKSYKTYKTFKSFNFTSPFYLKEKKNSVFGRKRNSGKNSSKTMTRYPILKNIKNENEKTMSNKKIDLYKDNYISNLNGVLRLPLLSNLISNTKVNLKQNYNKKKDEDNLIIKKYLKDEEYNKITELIEKDNEKTNKIIEDKFKHLEEKIKKNNLKRHNEETQEGYEALFKAYNEKRGKKNKIITNRILNLVKKKEDLINIHTLEEIENCNKNRFNNILLDAKGNPRYLMGIENDKKKELRLTDYELISLTNQANRKVEKLFPDLCTFHLPQVLRKNKEYTLKLLYDVFIEFKTLLKCGMIHNRNLNIHKEGIDFDTFFNCNTKINQQGIALSKKIFKAFNNKTNVNYMPWENYMDGMMKIKDPNIDNKLDLFFQILDENGDGSFDYNEVYNLSLISLQRVLPEGKKEDSEEDKEEKKENEEDKGDKADKDKKEENKDDKGDKEEKDNNEDKNENEDEEPNITNILAKFLTKYVFELVGIDIDGEIPIDLLRAKMDEKCAESEYLEFFLCADNFA